MSSSTPFEIRLDVLKMAQDMLDKETNLKREKILEESRLELSSNTSASAVNSASILSKLDNIMYTEEELMNKANRLYSFVSTSTKKP